MSAATRELVDFRALKQRHPLAEVVEASGVPLRGQGRVRQGPCPFHQENEPSFTVYQDTQRFYCFGCGAMGDVLDFLQRLHRMDLPGAIRMLEGTALPPPKIPVASHCPPSPPPPRSTAVLGAAARFYATSLWRSPEALAYLRSRGVSPTTASALGLGYARGDGLWSHLRSAGFDSEAIAWSGLFLDDGERFATRIVVPDLAGGKVTWLTGRSIGQAEPRFQALPGAKPVLGAARLGNPRVVVLTEGLFDWIVLTQWGVPACATLGSHGLDRVAAALAKCTRVYLVMDADDAGNAGTEQLLSLLGPRAVPVSLPYEAKDVAELGTRPRGRDVFLGVLSRARCGA